MGGKRFPGFIINQLLRIAVVCADKHLSVYFLNGIHCLAHALVYCLNRLDRSGLHAGMPYHVRVGKVNDNHIVLSGLNSLYQIVTHLISAHLRFQVVGRNLRRLYKDTVLSLIRFLHAAVKEECNVGILLRLCNTRLL